MFKALVLACAIGSVSPGTCIEATDERGPYATREECVMRVHQMVSALAATMPVPMQYSYKCEEPNGTPA